jgi:polyphenol oxidase
MSDLQDARAMSASMPPEWIVPDWPAPGIVRALITTRLGGVSRGPYSSMNLGIRVDDDPDAVKKNRSKLRALLPGEPKWLAQVHGARVVDADTVVDPVEADAAYSRKDAICAVLIADCMPILLCDRDGQAVAAAHAGWRGLASGVLEATVSALRIPPARLHAFLGPAIGPDAFEVGEDVYRAFVSTSSPAASAFRPKSGDKWMCDLFAIARQQLQALGILSVHGGGLCTYSNPSRFFSHRRDKTSGRMAALIWRET